MQIRPASHLWGQLTAPTQEAIRNELGDERINVAQIGPAGENQVRIAAIMNDKERALARGGGGADRMAPPARRKGPL